MWAGGLSVAAHGARFGVRVSDGRILPALQRRLPPDWSVGRNPVVDHLVSVVVGGTSGALRRFHLMYANGLRLSRTHDIEDLLDTFESHVAMAVAETARGRVFVHAGVVGWRGRAILIPGASHSGKSTLVAALVRAGATYFSDEYAVLDSSGRVHPFPRLLQLRGDGGRQKRVDVRSIGGRAASASLPVGLVVVTRYQAGRRWRPRAVSPGRGLLDLLAHTVPARRRPRAALSALQRVVVPGRVVESTRGEADETAPRLLRLAEGGIP